MSPRTTPSPRCSSSVLAGDAGAEQKLYVLSSAGDAVNVIDVATDRILSSIQVGSGRTASPRPPRRTCCG